MTPRVSVVVPVHDVRPWLSTCLDSALAQTERNLEVIAVDDGSTDGSGDVCDAYAAVDPRVRVVHKLNGGLSDARNAGLAAAEGEWVMFLDGDDWIAPEAVASMLSTCVEFGVDVVVSGFHVDVHDAHGALVDTERRVPAPHVMDVGAPGPPPVSIELLNIVGYAWNKLYRRRLLTETGTEFPVGVSLVEDILFNAPVLQRADAIAFVDEAFVHYVQRPRPTLGTKPQPDFARLMARASEAITGLLLAWGVTRIGAEELVHEVEVARVQWAVRSVLTTAGPTRPRLAAARGLLRDPAVRSVLSREVARTRLTGPRGWVLATQARGLVVPTLLALRARGGRK